jgi:hypothetical protein
VLVSIVIAIAVTEILATWGRMIRLRGTVRPYWVHVGWMAVVLLLAIQFWWSLWELREWPDWNFFQYVLSLLPFLTLVVLTFLLCPDPTAVGEEGMEGYFFENSGWFFTLSAVFLLELMVINPVLRPDPWLGVDNAIRLLAIAAIVPLAVTKSRTVHAGALIACAALLMAFVLFSGQ